MSDIYVSMQFRSLVVIASGAAPVGKRGIYWLCRCCECGKEKTIRSSYLRDGTASCLCMMAKSKQTHGLADSPEYKVWDGARRRCYNKKDVKYHLYGGRGIKMCDRWRKSFQNFINDMGRRPSPGHSIERKDGNGDYSPDNCMWATVEQQNNNRRSYNRYLVFDGKRVTVAQASRLTGIPHATILSRLDAGKSDEEATAHA